ncbi:beta strand repeat-containing protein [Flavobacterium aurantiibacter]|uniref:BIG2 domain-containing protein n=1 Tax=Flavobacterium aurantiibacter TaxID=2023067 RepID=A0A256A7F1_9FLAO|nr:YDG domain-containing protein [Flavobacterium aurantiibacter]OYQ49657.1 hypothetical protein CHX27_01320 [Flavobacterium aurantiibacter]
MKSELRIKVTSVYRHLVFLIFLVPNSLLGQVSITGSAVVTQNFNGIGNSATAVLPSGFRIGTDYNTATSATTLAYGSSGANAVAGNSSGGVVNWANGVTASSTDRALGFLNSGSFSSPRSIVVAIQNSGSAAITSIAIAFDYEKYRTGMRAFAWTFFHGSSSAPATANASGDQSYAADGANSVVNPPTSISKSFTLNGLNIAPGALYYFRWTLTGNGGSTNGQGLGLDNLSFTATFQESTTPTITVAATTAAFSTTYGTASAPQIFSISGSNLTANLVATAPAGFEVSADGILYASTATFSPTSGSVSGSLRIRLSATAPVIGNYNSNSIVMSSANAASVSITSPASGNFVSPKNVTIEGITGDNKVYDRTTDATFSGTPTYSGLVNGEFFAVIGNTFAEFDTQLVGNSKLILVDGFEAPSSNYVVSQPTLTAVITKRGVSIVGLIINNKPYDGNATASFDSSSAVLDGVIAPDVVSLDLSLATAAFETTNAGTGINVSVSGIELGGADAANYELSEQPNGLKATIGKANQIISFGPLNPKQDNDPDFALTATADSGLAVTYSSSNEAVSTISGDIVSILATGTTTITATQKGNENYNPATAVAQLLIVTSTAKQDQTITFNPLTAATYGDMPFMLQANSSSGLAVNYTSSNSAVATVTGSTLTILAPGTTVITVSQEGDTDFNPATTVQQTLIVNRKDIAVVGVLANSKAYDGTTFASISGGSLAGIVGTDDVSFSGNGTFTDASSGSGKEVVTAFVLGGSDSSKYNLLQTVGLTATITTKELTLAGISIADKQYDGGTAATIIGVLVLNGVVSTDISNVTIDSTAVVATFETANIGSIKEVNVVGYTLSGSASANYFLTQPNLTGNINQRVLSIAGITVEDKVYDGTTTAQFSGLPSLNGIVGSESVSVSGVIELEFQNANAENDKTLTIGGIALVGIDSGNYLIGDLSLTASIFPAILTYNADAATRVFNIANQTFTGTVTGFVNAEDISATSGTLNFVTSASNLSAPGTYPIIGTGLTANNYIFEQNTTNATALTITKADQTISFGTLPAKTTADLPFALTATSSSGLQVTYESTNPNVAVISGNTITIIGSGTTEITASQGGDATLTCGNFG